MGCDIHLFVEVRKNDQWEAAGKPVINQYFYEDKPSEYLPKFLTNKQPEPSFAAPMAGEHPYIRERFYSDRNYALFGILANVRWLDIQPIAEARGIPKNASLEYKTVAEEEGEDGHTHSYLTVQEILAYDWTQTIKTTLFMSLKTYFDWSNYGRYYGEFPKPNYYTEYDGIFVENSPDKYISENQAIEILKNFEEEVKTTAAEDDRHDLFSEKIESFGLTPETNRPDKNDTFYDNWAYDKKIYVKTEKPLYMLVEEFWKDTMPRLLSLGKPEDVRIVFFFDN